MNRSSPGGPSDANYTISFLISARGFAKIAFSLSTDAFRPRSPFFVRADEPGLTHYATHASPSFLCIVVVDLREVLDEQLVHRALFPKRKLLPVSREAHFGYPS